MNIKLLKPYGYCPGVINAIKEVKKLRKDNPTENIYMFGRLIHNELIDSLMNELNIKVIDCEYDKYFEYINKLNIDGRYKLLKKTGAFPNKFCTTCHKIFNQFTIIIHSGCDKRKTLLS